MKLRTTRTSATGSLLMGRAGLAALARLALAFTLVAGLAAPALALPPVLEQAKKDGIVGEQVNGYLGLVKGSAPGDVRSAMDEVNSERKKLYQERAKAQGTDSTTYAAVVGQRQVSREPKGNWVRTDKGWEKK
jgi:uncharacterized protein YdbL (DUF1318 family)